MKNDILNLTIGSKIWNVCGLSEIVEITAKGTNQITGLSYIYVKCRFSKDSTITASIREEKAIYKDGYLCNADIVQFIYNHKVSDFLN